MIVEVRNKSQITIPKEIAKSMGINVGDKLELVERNGTIIMIPVVTYPKSYVASIEKELEKFNSDFKEGKVEFYRTADEVIKSLEEKAK